MADRKVAICTPIFRQVDPDFMASVFAVLQNFPAHVKFIHCVGHANLARSRNYLVQQARDWGATDIVFIDADIGFEPEAFIALFETEVRIIAGCPQRRVEGIAFCGAPDAPAIRRQGDGFLHGQAATAFLRVEASVFDELEAHVPAYNYQGRSTPAFFEVGIREGDMLDEDIWFSRLCADHNIGVFLNPDIRLRHWHTQPLTVVMADHIKREPLKEVANG